MMAPMPVAARDGAMKEKQVFWHIMFWNASIESCLNSLLISCHIDRLLNASLFPAQRLLSDQSVINQRSMYGGGKKRVFHCPVACCFGNAILSMVQSQGKSFMAFRQPRGGKVCLPQRRRSLPNRQLRCLCRTDFGSSFFSACYFQ